MLVLIGAYRLTTFSTLAKLDEKSTQSLLPHALPTGNPSVVVFSKKGLASNVLSCIDLRGRQWTQEGFLRQKSVRGLVSPF